MVFCSTVTLASTNKHDTVVGSSPRANHSTLTDGCEMALSTQPPFILPASSHVAHRLLSYPLLIWFLIVPIHTSLFFSFMPQWIPREYPFHSHLLSPFLFSLSAPSLLSASSSSLLLLALSHCILPRLRTHPALPQGDSLTRKWKNKQDIKSARPLCIQLC